MSSCENLVLFLLNRLPFPLSVCRRIFNSGRMYSKNNKMNKIELKINMQVALFTSTEAINIVNKDKQIDRQTSSALKVNLQS